MQRFFGATQYRIICFNSSRCGHGDIIIKPSAFKENVASGTGFSFSVLAEYFVGIEGGALRVGLFFSYL